MGCAFCKRPNQAVTFKVSDLSPEWQLTVLTDIDYDSFLTNEESEMLIKRWQYFIEDVKFRQFGFTFFAKFFLYAPDAQNIFFKMHQGGTPSQYVWQRHPLFLSHVRRAMSGIDVTISLLHRPEELARHMNRLREIHHRYTDIKVIHGEIFVKTLEDCVAKTLGKVYTNDYKTVFRKFLTLLYSIIFHDLQYVNSEGSVSTYPRSFNVYPGSVNRFTTSVSRTLGAPSTVGALSGSNNTATPSLGSTL